MKRILAWLGILTIAAAFLALVYCSATGAPSNVIMAIVTAMILIPVLIYGFIMAAKAFSGKQEPDADEPTSNKQ